MTIVNQSIALMTSSVIDTQDILYKNRLANATEAVGVGAIPADFYVASIFRGGDDNEVFSISFFDETFSKMIVLDWELYGENFPDKDHGSLVNAALTELSMHKDAQTTIDAMNFTVVVREDGVMEDVDFSGAHCIIEMQESAMRPLTALTEAEQKALQQAASGGGEAFDMLPILDKELVLDAGKDFYQDIIYRDAGLLRMVIVDGQVYLDPHSKFTKIVGNPDVYLRLAVTDLADDVDVRPACMR